MVATLNFLNKTFDKFNEEIFNNSLDKPKFRIMNQKTRFGCLSYSYFRGDKINYVKNSVVLSISEYYDESEEAIIDTIIHEMIHLYILQNKIIDTSDHGKVFIEKMNFINKTFNRHIQVTSNSRNLSLSNRNRNKVYNAIILKNDKSNDDYFAVMRVSTTLFNVIDNKVIKGYSIYKSFKTNNEIYDRLHLNSITSKRVKVKFIPKESLSKYL